jgi:beta-N-acetylhexosaminidase
MNDSSPLPFDETQPLPLVTPPASQGDAPRSPRSPAPRHPAQPVRWPLILAGGVALGAVIGLLVVLLRRWLVVATTTIVVAIATATAAPPTATPAPGATSAPSPTAAPTTPTDQQIDAYINALTPDQQIGQLLMVMVYTNAYNSQLDQALRQWHIANALVYTQYNGGPLMPTTLAGLRQLVGDLHSHADQPPLISIDEEGGGVDRLAPYYGATPSPWALAATGDPQRAYTQAQLDASRLRDLGINADFAPLADVFQGGVEDQTRTFGTSAAQVAQFAGAFLNGLQQNGIAGTLKHWPDIGSENADPETTLPTIAHSQAQLNAVDFASFRALLANQPGMIMATHVLVPAYDQTYPASLSPTLINGVLRGQLGYQGVVITDSMDMGSVIQFMQGQGISDVAQAIAAASVQAILAGDDIIECPIEQDRLAAVVAAVKAAVQSGRISPERLRQSLRRIIRLKARMGLITLPGYSAAQHRAA